MPNSTADPNVAQKVAATPGEHSESRFCPELDRVLAEVTCSWQSRSRLVADRRWHRLPYEAPIALTPCHMHGEPLAEVTAQPGCRVTGRDLSQGGLSFVHFEPLPYRYVLATFGETAGQRATVLVQLNWCRFTRGHVYHSGGRFLRVIENSPFNTTVWDVESLPHA